MSRYSLAGDALYGSASPIHLDADTANGAASDLAAPVERRVPLATETAAYPELPPIRRDSMVIHLPMVLASMILATNGLPFAGLVLLSIGAWIYGALRLVGLVHVVITLGAGS